MSTTFRTRKKTPPAPARKAGSDESDPFVESIRRILDEGRISRTEGSELKSLVVARVQDYSIELSFSGDAISELFLELCDLMLDGRLAKMPDDAFRVFLAVMAHTDTTVPDSPQAPETLAELTGITNPSAVEAALQHLRVEGYLQPPGAPPRPAKGLRGTEAHDGNAPEDTSSNM